MNVKISQSLIKGYSEYKSEKLCGLLFKAKYIDRNLPFVTSPSMQEGIYFEYLATGSLPKSGEVPQPEYTLKKELKEPYKRIVQAVELFKKIITHYDIKILEVGFTLQNDEKSGVLDILAEWNGEVCIIDLKYSGLIDDKWNELGWDLDSLPEKDNLMMQGVHYKMLAKEILGVDDIPFYYFIFNSKNPNDMKIVKQHVDEDRYFFHQVNIDKVRNGIEKELFEGFKAYPNYRKCIECPLFEKCELRAEYPLINEVYY
jgi:hypothetical protein